MNDYWKIYRELIQDADDEMLRACKKHWLSIWNDEHREDYIREMAATLLAVIATEEERRAR